MTEPILYEDIIKEAFKYKRYVVAEAMTELDFNAETADFISSVAEGGLIQGAITVFKMIGCEHEAKKLQSILDARCATSHTSLM